MKIINSAILTLTGWYLFLIMLLSISFSVVLYQVSSQELGRGLPRGGQLMINFFPDQRTAFEQYRLEQLEASNNRLKAKLVVINIATLMAGGALSYLLARRTLQPINEAMEAQARFTSDASHELRTPLTAMQTEIEVALRDKSLNKNDLSKLLASNLEEVEKLRTLSDRLLRLTSGRELPKSVQSIELIILEAVNRYLPSAKQKNISIKSEVRDLKVYGNADQLTDAVAILLDNAIKYSPENSKISVKTTTDKDEIKIIVKDRGRGISASELPHIFERFYRADSSRNKKIDGYGLGLAIAKRVIDSHKGRIEVHSVQDKGSTFLVYLPQA